MLEVIPDKEQTGQQTFPCVLPKRVAFLPGPKGKGFADFSAQRAMDSLSEVALIYGQNGGG